MSSAPSVLQLTSVCRTFSSTGAVVLSDINLTIGQGEIFGLLGPSGSGKTTLIKLMTGIDQASAGTVEMLHTPLPNRAMMQQFGYMAQADALYSELTAKENMRFFASLYGLKGKQRMRRIEETLAIVDLLDHLHKPIAAYSGGMKRRLSLAIALLHEPSLLILDEPTVGIDPVLRQSIWQELLALRNSGVTIVVTTHVMDEAAHCDRLGLIRQGKLIAVDSPAAIIAATNSTTIEEAFITLGKGDRE
ncbi:ABC transporter ATP-binding protein [Paenibacillus sp. GCM10027626]|uniref:ABC transporter ATP-binding protein n=1 Tax=Paenibacillus sp. GCM10027626 TaxID=3273411 RepID=UPI003632A96F